MILLAKEKKMNDLHNSVDKNKLYFEYVGPNEDVSFYEHMDSKELFNKFKNSHISFSDAHKSKKIFLKN